MTKEISKIKHNLHPGNVVHSARLEFSLHIKEKKPRSIQNLTLKKHFTAKAAKEKESEVEYKNPCYINIKFTTTGGISYDLYHPLISYLNKPARRAFDHLQHLTYHNNQELQTVKFRVDVNPEKINNAAYFLEALVNLSKHLPSSKPYNAYRAHGNDPRIKYSQQVPHLLVKQDYGIPLVKFRPTDFFHDIDSYIMKFAYRTIIEW